MSTGSRSRSLTLAGALVALASSSVSVAVVFTACSESAGPTTSRTVSGLIEYDGRGDGPLEVAVFRTFPPSGAPMASVRIESPSFPQEYAIHGVPPGDYYVLAIIDTFENDGHRYHPNVDPGGAYGRYEAPSSVELKTVDQLESIDITLVDPSDSSPWARQGYE